VVAAFESSQLLLSNWWANLYFTLFFCTIQRQLAVGTAPSAEKFFCAIPQFCDSWHHYGDD
jgi:hypothetical protein